MLHHLNTTNLTFCGSYIVAVDVSVIQKTLNQYLLFLLIADSLASHFTSYYVDVLEV